MLSFYSTCRESTCDLILQEKIRDHDGERADQCPSGKDAPFFVELTGSKDLQSNHQGVLIDIVQQDSGEDKVAVGANKGQDPDHNQDGP